MGSFKNKQILYSFVEILIFCLLVWFYNCHTVLLSKSSNPYSKLLAHRLQADAFLHGKLSLSSHPFALPWDFTWSECGMQQNWGLGIPALMVPFEWIYRVCGWGPAPDRYIMVFYLTLMIIMLNITFRRIFLGLGFVPHQSIGILIRWGLIAWILFCPAMSNLIQGGQLKGSSTYNFTVYYGCMYSYVLLSVLWMCILKPQRRIFIILCLASGFAWMIRPSLIVYGVVTAVLAAVGTFQETRSRRLILQGICCFLLGIMVNLWTNDLRFGSPFEFGGSLQISGNPLPTYLLRFENPFLKEPILSAAKELFGATFFNGLWQTNNYHRERYYEFFTFNGSHFIVVLTGFVVLIYFLFLKFLKRSFYFSEDRRVCFRALCFSLSWGGISCGLFFISYTHFIAFASRYAADFTAAIHAILVSLVLLGLFYLTSFGIWRKGQRCLLVLLFIVTIPLFYLNNKLFFELKSYKTDAVTKGKLVSLVNTFKEDASINKVLPDSFYCGRKYPQMEKWWPQFGGWRIAKDCAVSQDTLLFLPAKRCLTLNYSIAAHEPMPPIQVKRDIKFLALVDSKMIEDKLNREFPKQIIQRFCTEAPYRNNILQYTIGWVTADKLDDRGILPIKLNGVKVSD